MAQGRSSVQRYLDDLHLLRGEQAAIADELLCLFRKHGPSLEEGIKYGGIVFHRGGQIVAGIFAYKHHVSLEFSEGSTFDDPEDVLEGKGKFRRHLKFREVGKIDELNAEAFIRQALRKGLAD